MHQTWLAGGHPNPSPHQAASQVRWQNRTIKSYIYLYLSKGKMQTYIWPLLSSQLLSTPFLLCPCSPFTPFCSDTRDLPPQKLREVNLPLVWITQMSKINRWGLQLTERGARKAPILVIFVQKQLHKAHRNPLPYHAQQTSLPGVANWTVTNKAEGVSATRSPLHTLEIHWSRRHVAAVPVGWAKKTAKAGSSMSYPEGDSVSFLATWMRVGEPLLNSCCTHTADAVNAEMDAQHTWSAAPTPTGSSPCSSKEAKCGIHLANLKTAQNNSVTSWSAL